MSANIDVVTELPGGWVKRCNQRQSGTNALKWDVYLTPPNGRSKTIRSVPDLARFLSSNPDIEIDPLVINMDPPGVPQGTITSGTKRIMEAIKSIKSGETPTVAAGRAPKAVDADGAALPAKRPKVKPAKYDAAEINFNWSKVLGGRKSKTTARKSTARKSTGSKAMSTKYIFSQKQLNYLERQYIKVPTPTSAQFDFLSRQLKAPLDDVTKWFYTKRRRDLEEEERRRQQRQSLDDLQSLLEPQVDITELEDSGVSYGISSSPKEASSSPSKPLSEDPINTDPLNVIEGPEEKVTIEHEDAEVDTVDIPE